MAGPAFMEFGTTGGTATGSNGGSSLVKPKLNLDWQSFIKMLESNRSQQRSQLPLQPLQTQQFPGSNVQTAQLQTPQMFPPQSKDQASSLGEVEQWAKFIQMIFA